MRELSGWLGAKLDEDSKLDEEAKYLVLAALEGDEALADVGGFAQVAESSADGEGAPPAGAYLRQVRVQGFRGIGPSAQLDLQTGPGLTIVTGRNGSGKSSFAEALEVALTGSTFRWKRRTSAQWEDAWRNLHDPAPPLIEVTLAEEGVGPTRLTVQWLEGAGKEDAVIHLQRHGKKRQAGIESLGWSGPMQTYRPLLTYDELAGLFAVEPSKLHDAISSVLGLERVSEAVGRLDVLRKRRGAPGAELDRVKKALIGALSELDDDRAEQALTLLKARRVDPAALRSLASDASGSDGALGAWLRGVQGVSLPSGADVTRAADRLRAAVGAVAEAGDQAAEALERRRAVIAAALSVHEHDGDVACPACGEGRLDKRWAVSAKADLSHSDVLLDRLRQARAEVRDARRAAATLVAAVPEALSPVDPAIDLLVERTVTAWKAWADHPGSDLELVDHLTRTHPELSAALQVLQAAASRMREDREEAWSPLARRILAFADGWVDWADLKPQADLAGVAHKWLKDRELALKNDRVQPIAEQAGRIWEELRQESNVEVSGLTLQGAATRRRVRIGAAVDGEEAGALAVMSQGELHALALALFLPRATMAQSPFRFVVLDDPVQAMDPAKVDGLVRVLARIAQDRQVVVFTHDDRLAAAVRRSPTRATIVEVTREHGSRVTVTNVFDPPQRYLRDARALLRDDKLPEDTLRAVLPGILRFAVEAQARDTFFTSSLARGQHHVDVEDAWSSARRTSARVDLALGEGRFLDSWLGQRPYRSAALGIVTSAVHEGLKGDPRFACEVVGQLVDDVRGLTT